MTDEGDKDRLSAVSKRYDVTGDGVLNSVEQRMRDMDTTGQGYLDNATIYSIFQDLEYSQKRLLGNKRILTGLIIFVILQSTIMFGLVFLSVYLSKDFSPNGYGMLVGKNDKNIVIGGLSFDVPDVVVDGVDRPVACISSDTAAAMYDSALSKVPMNLRVTTKAVFGLDSQEFTFDLQSVQKSTSTICFRNGENAKFACIDFDSDACDDGISEDDAVDDMSTDNSGNRRLAFAQSLDKYRGIESDDDEASGLRRRLSESSSTVALILDELPMLDESDLEATEFVNSTSLYKLIYLPGSGSDGNRTNLYLKAHTELREFKNPPEYPSASHTFTSGVAGGDFVEIVEVHEGDITELSKAEYHWRIEETQLTRQVYVANRVSGRRFGDVGSGLGSKIGRDGEFGKVPLTSESLFEVGVFSQNPQTWEYNRVELYEWDTPGSYAIVFPTLRKSPDGGLEKPDYAQAYVRTRSDGKMELSTFVVEEKILSKCVFEHEHEYHCKAHGNEYWNTKRSVKTGCSNKLKGKPRCRRFVPNHGLRGWGSKKANPHIDHIDHQFSIVDAPKVALWAPPDMLPDNDIVPYYNDYGSSSDWVDKALEAAADIVTDITLDIVKDLLNTQVPFLGTFGVGIFTGILDAQEEAELDKRFDEIYDEIGEIYKEIAGLADWTSDEIDKNAALTRINNAVNDFQSAYVLKFKESVNNYKFRDLLLEHKNQTQLSDEYLGTNDHFDEALDDAKTAIKELRKDFEVGGFDTAQYLYTVRFGWHRTFIPTYTQYMEIVEEYLLLFAYTYAKGYHEYAREYEFYVNQTRIEGNEPLPSCLEPTSEGGSYLDSLLNRKNLPCYQEYIDNNIPDIVDYEYGIEMLREGFQKIVSETKKDFVEVNRDVKTNTYFDYYKEEYRCDKILQYEMCEGTCTRTQSLGGTLLRAQQVESTWSPYSTKSWKKICGQIQMHTMTWVVDQQRVVRLDGDVIQERFMLDFFKKERQIAASQYYNIVDLNKLHEIRMDVFRTYFDAVVEAPDIYTFYAERDKCKFKKC